MDTSLLAVFAKIVVAANRTHESNTTDWAHLTTIANNSVKDFISLVWLSLDHVVPKHLSELDSTVFTHFFTDHLNDFTNFFGWDSSRALAFPAWKVLLVYRGAHAFEAGYRFLCKISFFIIRNDNLTADFSFFDIALHLGPNMGLQKLDAVTSSVLGCLDVLAAYWAHLYGVSSNRDLICLDFSSHTACIVLSK